MDWPYLLNGFDGRIGRKTFWIAMGALMVANIGLCLLAEEIGGSRLSDIVDLAFTYPEFAVATKRAHDRNMPLWIVIVFFVANAALDLLDVLGWTGTPDNMNPVLLMITALFLVLSLVLLVELGFRRGTVGSNQYGPDPLAKV